MVICYFFFLYLLDFSFIYLIGNHNFYVCVCFIWYIYIDQPLSSLPHHTHTSCCVKVLGNGKIAITKEWPERFSTHKKNTHTHTYVHASSSISFIIIHTLLCPPNYPSISPPPLFWYKNWIDEINNFFRRNNNRKLKRIN